MAVNTTLKIDCRAHGHIEITTEAPIEVWGTVCCPFSHCEDKISEVDIWVGGIKVATWKLDKLQYKEDL